MAITNSYLTSTKNLESIINSVINAKAPERFTNKFLEDLGYKSSNDRLVIGMFKALGLLDDNGQPLQRYYEFLDQTQTGRIIAIGIEEAYEDLFNLRKDAQNLTNDECVESAKVMATVYTAIAAFENMVRQFVVKILMENKGENWWTECVSDKIRKSADSRKAEEDKIKWHTHRGTSMINYVDFADLANIMGQNYDLFEVHIVSLEWAKQIFTTLEKSRNVIMHSGELGERDIERIGINIRDWISQVGA